MKKGRKVGSVTSMEGWMMQYGEKGEMFYSGKTDRALTAIANHTKRKIKTERMIVVGGSQTNPFTDTVVKVTLLDDPLPNEDKSTDVLVNETIISVEKQIQRLKKAIDDKTPKPVTEG